MALFGLVGPGTAMACAKKPRGKREATKQEGKSGKKCKPEGRRHWEGQEVECGRVNHGKQRRSVDELAGWIGDNTEIAAGILKII